MSEIIATNTDGDVKVTLHRSENKAYHIELNGEVVEFGLTFQRAFPAFGTQIMWACIRANKIPTVGG